MDYSLFGGNCHCERPKGVKQSKKRGRCILQLRLLRRFAPRNDKGKKIFIQGGSHGPKRLFYFSLT